MTQQLAPLRVWDARSENYPGDSAEWLEAFHAWVEAHGVSIKVTYRIAYYVIDVPFIRVYQRAHDAAGRCFVDPATGDIALRDPFDVLITCPPPDQEEYR